MRHFLVILIFLSAVLDTCLADNFMTVRMYPCSKFSEEKSRATLECSDNDHHSDSDSHESHSACHQCHVCHSGIPLESHIVLNVDDRDSFQSAYTFSLSSGFLRSLKYPPKRTA